MPDLHAFDRAGALQRLADEQFDVLVVGGGITGAGVALDAASRGLRAALVERGDFASGTSSRSSKLVHGGLRYLRQGRVELVYESLAERQRLLRNAPHLVAPLPFVIPLFGKGGVASKAAVRSYATALWLYDLAGGWRIGTRHLKVSRAETLAHLPDLAADDLVAGFVYFDAHADDARLTLAILRTAVVDHGAVAANYAGVTELVTERGRIVGARISPGPAEGGRQISVRARAVVNATGIWADDLRALDEGTHPRSLRPAKGVHVTVPAARLPADVAVVLRVRRDSRDVFVVPWPECAMTYIGTTDTDHAGPLESPAATPQDVDYLLDAVNAGTTAGLTRSDVAGVWAGLRPLLARGAGGPVPTRTADLSRRHSVRVSPAGLVTVTGGKLTTYRKMAEDTVDAVAKVIASTRPGRQVPRSSTRRLKLRGATAGGRVHQRLVRKGAVPSFRADGGPFGDFAARDRTAHLDDRYGTESTTVLGVAAGRPELLQPVVKGLPYLGAEVVWAARAEMAQSVEDVLCRRTRATLQDARAAVRAAEPVARLLAEELGWSSEQAAAEAGRFAAAVTGELGAAGIPTAVGEPR